MRTKKKRKELEEALRIYGRYAVGILPENEKEEKALQKFLELVTI